MNVMKKILICALLFVGIGAAVFAQPTISASIDDASFALNEIVTVKVLVDDNPGMRGLFFDLSFDGQKLELLDLQKGLMAQREIHDAELLYARSDSTTSSSLGHHLIVSYALTEEGNYTRENGSLVELRFRVIEEGVAQDSFQFTFNDFLVFDKDNAAIAGAQWKDSAKFVLGSTPASALMSIKQPLNNEAFHTENVSLSAIFTPDAAYTVIVRNETTGYASALLDGSTGNITGLSVPLEFGSNKITATLFDGSSTSIATDSVIVVRATDEKYIKIKTPTNHALVNTDMVEVFVSSSFAGPTVNNLAAEATGQKDIDNSNNDIYRTLVWLKEGFNTITAAVAGGGRANYKDEISIYYHKDDAVFSFVAPRASESFKTTTEGATLTIKGEIGSKLDDQYNPNTVHVSAIYHPQNPLHQSKYLLDSQLAEIKESDIVSGGSQAPFMFTLPSSLNIEGLESGSIELIAYKNKKGSSWKDEIHRFVYVHNNRLYIDLVQPNIFNDENLDTQEKINAFSDPDAVFTNTVIGTEGNFTLVPSTKALDADDFYLTKTITDLERFEDGSIYALVNEPGGMKIYRQAFGASTWTELYSSANYFGYDICETNLGALVGVSNIYSTGDSGLYLLQGNKLKNIVIGEPIPHVQFINNLNGEISLYGNDYSHLYTFNMYSLEDDGARLKAAVVDKYIFDNNLYIDEFVLANNNNTAILRTTDNEIQIFTRNANGSFKPAILNGTKINSSTDYTTIVQGNYRDSDYIAYALFEKDTKNAFVIMEHKEQQRFISHLVDFSSVVGTDVILGAGFYDNRFSIIGYNSTDDDYNVYRVKFLFNTIDWGQATDKWTYDNIDGPVFNAGDFQVLHAEADVLYAGFGSGLSGLRKLYNQYPSSGSVVFEYSNSDIEGIKSIEFEADSIWSNAAEIQFGFAVISGSELQFGTLSNDKTAIVPLTLADLLSVENSSFSVSKEWDAETGNDKYRIEFDSVRKDVDLKFDIRLDAVGNTSPEISALTIQKKVPVKLPRPSSGDIVLPIHGFVYDPTVDHVSIMSQDVKLERDGSFSHNYVIDSDLNKVTINIWCKNIAGESTALSFDVELFDSINSISNIRYFDSQNQELFITTGTNNLLAAEETISVSGDYTGLIGAIVGYETLDEVTSKILETGVFSLNKNTPSGGYESGTFSSQTVKLHPGNQYLKLYVENPGGHRTEIKYDHKYPLVNYTLPADKQEIVLTNTEIKDLTTTYTVDTVVVDEIVELIASESLNAPYVFTRDFTIRGEIKSIYEVASIKVRSTNGAMTLAGGFAEKEVSVDDQGRFQFDIAITMPEEIEEETFELLLTPTAPFLNWMKTGLSVHVKKAFADTNIIPDFSLMHGDQWTAAEIEAMEKPLRIKIDRFVPSETSISMIVNYETEITGILEEINPGQKVYRVKSGLEELDLKGIKLGANRIQWWLYHDNRLISSSASGKSGMSDEVFQLSGTAAYAPTVVTFPVAMQTYYDGSTSALPGFSLTKDKTTDLQVYLNDELVWQDPANTMESFAANFSDSATYSILEGKNTVKVSYSENTGYYDALEYAFFFDTLNPEVAISSFGYNSDYTRIEEITATIHEANLKFAAILYGADSATASQHSQDPKITYIGDNRYLASWSSLNLDLPVNQYLYVKVKDHAGREIISSPLNRLDESITRPDAVATTVLNIAASKFVPDTEASTKLFFEDEPGDGPFTSSGRLKFFNSNIDIEGLTIADGVEDANKYSLRRPGDIAVGSTGTGRAVTVGDGTTDGNLEIRSGGRVAFKPGFSVKLGSTLKVFTNETAIAAAVADPYDVDITSVPAATTAMSYGFHIRYEQKDTYAVDNEYRRILTIYDKEITPNLEYKSVYLAYKNSSASSQESIDVSLILENKSRTQVEAPWGYTRTELISGPAITRTGLIGSMNGFGWNLIVLGVDSETHLFNLAVNSNQSLTGELKSAEDNDYLNIWADILDSTKSHYFGSQSSTEAGHYSIARPFFVDRLIGMEEVADFQADLDNGPESYPMLASMPDRVYGFNSVTDDFGSEYYNLSATIEDSTTAHTFDPLSPAVYNNFYSADEDANYSTSGGGSFLASAIHKNYLSVNGSGRIIFSNADNPITYDLSLSNTGTALELTPTVSTRKGKYIFANNSGNHGLTNNKHISVFGTVIKPVGSTIKDPDAEIVLRINGKEARQKLHWGDFHLVFDNSGLSTPSTVVMYVETADKIALDHGMIITEGDYVLPPEAVNGFTKNHGTTEYVFHSTGTVSLWYKPINTNSDGFCSYEATILDSEYVVLSTKFDSSGYATFMAELKGESNGKTFHSNIPVTGGWHHLQVSYSVADDLAYFYVDGKIAGKSESVALPLSPTMLGDVNTSTVYFGSDNGLTQYAEGYLDSISLTHLYKDEGAYSDNSPISISYTETRLNPLNLTSVLTITDNLSGATSNIEYVLESKDGSFRQTSNPSNPVDHGFDIAGLNSGSYKLTASMVYNGSRYDETFTFIKNNRPRFVTSSVTPLIISGVEGTVRFEFTYDNSYLIADTSGDYAGLAIQIAGDANGVFTDNIYIFQDPINYTTSGWGILWYDSEGVPIEQELLLQGNKLVAEFNNVLSIADISWESRSFYYNGVFAATTYAFDNVAPGETGSIPMASLTVEKITKTATDGDELEYKLKVVIGNGAGKITSSVLNNLTIGHRVVSTDPAYSYEKETVLALKNDKEVYLYYDDILPQFGTYNCTVSLRYLGESYYSQLLPLTWVDTASGEEEVLIDERLDIIDFSLLRLNKTTGTAQLYLEYEQSGIEELEWDLVVYDSENNKYSALTPHSGIVGDLSTGFIIIDGITVPEGESYVELHLTSKKGGSQHIVRSINLRIANFTDAPELVLTNTVPSLISYNNVFFSWKGLLDGVFNSAITYQYNFDGQGWSAESNKWRSLELYDLEEGYHSFRLKALYQGQASVEESVTFFVDIEKPVFDSSKFTIVDNVDQDSILESVTISGSAGAVVDASLTNLYIDGKSVDPNADGSFGAVTVDLKKDGINEIVLSAYDKVGNLTDYTLSIDNYITRILFPETRAIFAPVTVVGQINPAINTPLDIYLADPEAVSYEEGDFSSWKKATINKDRTFFIEDVYVAPGTSYRDASTDLKLAVKTESGTIYTKLFNVLAAEMTMPIEMDLSAHAVEGQNSDTSITINCIANVGSVSSWSIDYTGDGIYDEVYTTSSPKIETTKTWTHRYSSLGLVKPRVRVITPEGNYFSVSDQILIHEKIKEASNVLIQDPVAMDSLRMDDGSERIFVLAGSGSSYRVEVYEVGRNETYISDMLYTISLNGSGIDNPVQIAALNDETFYIGSNRAGKGYIHLFNKNEFGNFIYESSYKVLLNNHIKDLKVETGGVYATFDAATGVAVVPLDTIYPQKLQVKYISIDTQYSAATGTDLGLVPYNEGFIVADKNNQRLLSLDYDFGVLGYTGQFGTGEKQFLTPEVLAQYENRVFVFDSTRKDIQVFDYEMNTVATLAYSTKPGYENYLEQTALDDVAGLSALAREEHHRLFYYTLILSKSTGKLAMIRLPQWEELRAGVRNNKIVFLKDREVFTAKPNGADLSRLISSDSIPRIEGTLDYPALSPDGRQLVFTSRVGLYDGTGVVVGGNNHAYDNLYMMSVTGDNLTRIPLGVMDEYEIERPVFSNNGDKIIFSAKETGGNWQVYTYDMETGGVAKLFTSSENARFPYYSPDDRFVVFTTDYDGDEEIQIVDVQNVNMRIALTNNNVRDSFPVWNSVYPFEISNPDLNIESKIAFVSERGFHKGVHYAYISRPSESDIRVVLSDGTETGSDPDSAATELTVAEGAADYPSFTGDGKSIVFEHHKELDKGLLRYDYESNSNALMDLPMDATKPAGMKNTIVAYKAEPIDGNDVKLSWTPYTDSDIFYTVRFKLNQEGAAYVEKKFYTSGGAMLTDLEMGSEYLIQTAIVENGEDVAETQWKLVKMPKVAARPTITIDENNPYLVNLHAWKPEDKTVWKYSWIIDNQEIQVQGTQDYLYEFSTSGTKTIVLKAYDQAQTYTAVSDAVMVNIVSDIKPTLEYVLADNSSYIELSAENSLGDRIDWANTQWIISGPGQPPMAPVMGSQVIIPLTGFDHKINVNLRLQRVPVNGQATTDTLEENVVIDLDFKDVKPVITWEQTEDDDRTVVFTGANSIGNIDWYNALWTVYGDGAVLTQQSGKSSFAYRFPESGNEVTYTVSLTIPRMSDGQSETATVVVSIEATEIEPVIDYEILTLKEGTNTVGAKVLFSCGNSKGSSIDFTNARWSVPVAGSYGEQPTQIGPTAIYNLFSIEENAVVNVSLTLSRKGGSDPITVTKSINIDPGTVAETEILVEKTIESTSAGTSLILSALDSTGPNIDWEKTSWLIDGQYPQTGPVARVDLANSAEDRVVRYVCTLYRHGATPLVKQEEIKVRGTVFEPVISYQRLDEAVAGSSDAVNAFELTVRETTGINIDWERTKWYIFDGNQNVIEKQGATVSHAFSLSSEQMGYPVMVEMFYKGDSRPVVGYRNINVEADELTPVITWNVAGNRNSIEFKAGNSSGSNIDWSQTKWTFGDSSQAQFGPVVYHEYPVDTDTKEYKVSVTLTRRGANGETETATEYTTVKIGSDNIVPVITAKATSDGYLVLSAERSEGRGLMLDRTTWLFEGKGDNSSYTENTKEGVIRRDTENSSWNVGLSVTTEWGWPGTGATPSFAVSTQLSGGYQHSWGNDVTSYDGFKDKTQSFSTQNTHTGLACRRYVGNARRIMVTMFVYRIDPDGAMTGESITVNIDMERAKHRNGVSYPTRSGR